jgi:hypothetical protein
LQQVSAVDARGSDLDEHIAVTQRRVVHVGKSEDFGTARLIEDDRFHDQPMGRDAFTSRRAVNATLLSEDAVRAR